MRSVFVEPGAMRSELRLEECLRTDDGMGGFAESWRETGVVFGRIEPFRAQSLFAADQRLEEVTHRIMLRWRVGVASSMRLTRLSGTRVFEILTVHDPDESGRYLLCHVKEQGS